MKILKIVILSLIFLTISCENDAKLGDPCNLLKPASDGVTKIELKNLDCMTLDSDALCVSYSGNPSYCTQKCGPKRTCYNETTQTGDVICRSDETCIDATCYKTANVCSDTKTSNCIEDCSKDTSKTYLNGKCVDKTTVCSNENPTGTCDSGMECVEGQCVFSQCPTDYECVSPIQLQGHTLKGYHVCVKSTEITNSSSPCDNVTCSDHGHCVINEGNPTCNCDAGYIPSDNKLDCVLSGTK